VDKFTERKTTLKTGAAPASCLSSATILNSMDYCLDQGVH
jgi:hypothetical protein